MFYFECNVGCSDAICPLNTFIRLYEEKLPGDMEQECRSTGIKRKD